MDDQMMYSPGSYTSLCTHHTYPEAQHRSPYPIIAHHHHANQHESNWVPSFAQHAYSTCPVQSFTPDSLDGNNNENFAVNHMNGFHGQQDLVRHHHMKWPSPITSTPDKALPVDHFLEPSYPQVESYSPSEDEQVFQQHPASMYVPGECLTSIMPPVHHDVKREPDSSLDLLSEDYSSNSSSMGTIPGTVPDFYTGKFSLSDNSFHSPTSPGVPEDDERRKKRRERNKVAATKCRHKKKEHVVRLNIESERLESSNLSLKAKLAALEVEKNHLIDLLKSHQPFCLKMSRSTSALQHVHHHHHHSQNHSHESHVHHSG